MIRLKEEGAKDVPRFVETEDDGSFQVNYLPSGRYSLQITSNDITDAANSTMRPTEYKMVRVDRRDRRSGRPAGGRAIGATEAPARTTVLISSSNPDCCTV